MRAHCPRRSISLTQGILLCPSSATSWMPSVQKTYGLALLVLPNGLKRVRIQGPIIFDVSDTC